MKDEFVPYNLALRLKALGFDETCAMYYRPEMDGTIEMWYHQDERFDDAVGSQNSDNAPWVTCTAPIYQQAFKWIRKEFNIFAWVFYDNCGEIRYKIRLANGDLIYEYPTSKNLVDYGLEGFYLWETAELACLEKVISIAEKRIKTKVRITNYSNIYILNVFKLLREYTDYEFNCCKMITDEMNPKYYEEFKENGYPEPSKKCDITVVGNATEFIEKMKDLGRNCIILDDNDPTFEDFNNIYKGI